MNGDVSARLSLLDAQIVDVDGLPIGRVDDLEIVLPADGGRPAVGALLTGAEALGPRIGGPVGRLMARVSDRLRPADRPEGPTAIDAELVAGVEPMVELAVRFEDLPHVAGLERWLASSFVERLPGAGDAPD